MREHKTHPLQRPTAEERHKDASAANSPAQDSQICGAPVLWETPLGHLSSRLMHIDRLVWGWSRSPGERFRLLRPWWYMKLLSVSFTYWWPPPEGPQRQKNIPLSANGSYRDGPGHPSISLVSDSPTPETPLPHGLINLCFLGAKTALALTQHRAHILYGRGPQRLGHRLLGNGPQSRGWAAGEQAKLHLCLQPLPITRITT